MGVTPAGDQADAGTEQRILQAGLEVFSEVGYTRATIKRIAEQAGIKSTALLYWYHPSKRDLFDAVVAAYAPVLERVLAGARDIEKLSPEQFLSQFSARFLAAFAVPEVQKVFRMISQEPELIKGMAPLDELRPTNVYTFVEAYVATQIEAGVLRPDLNPRYVATALIGLLSSYLQAASGRSAFLPPPMPPGEYVSSTVELVLSGILKP